MAAQNKVFVVSQPALNDMTRGVYTNKKDFFDSINSIEGVDQIVFRDVLKYEQKKFNYSNIRILLNILMIGDSFRLKINFNDDTSKIIEVSVRKTNDKIKLK